MTYAIVTLAGRCKAFATSIYELERAMLECFCQSKEKNDGFGVDAKAADMEAADFEPVIGFGTVAASGHSIIATSAAETHGCKFLVDERCRDGRVPDG